MKAAIYAKKKKIMQSNNTKIFETDITEASSEFLIIAFFKRIYDKEYLWCMEYLDAAPNDKNIFPLGDWEEEINNSKKGCIISWNTLLDIFNSIFQIYDISIKCLDKENKEMFFLDIADSGIIYLEYQNEDILHNFLHSIVNHD